jgi:hypothetical protein
MRSNQKMSRPFARLLPGVAALAIIAGGASAASAAPILIQSGDTGAGQTETCAQNSGTASTCVNVTTHPAWQPNDPTFTPGTTGGFTNLTPSGAVWVSFADTGAGANSTFQQPGTVLTYTYTFMAPANAQFLGHLWSDDQASIWLDGMLVGGGTATDHGGTTYGAGGGYSISASLGAGGGGGGAVSGAAVIGGGGGGGGGGCDGCTPHTLQAVVTQEGSGTTSSSNPGPALLVVGEVSPSTVPEPATLALFGIGLAGAGFIRRKRKA